MNIAVTGALGHIGSQLIRELPDMVGDGEILLIDSLLTKRYCSLFDLPKKGRYRFMEEDIDTADLDTLLGESDVVFHLAAITDASSSFGNEAQIEKINFEGTEKVATACVKNECALFYVSTTSVYGPQSEVVFEDCSDDDLNPQSPYADSKLRGEKLLQAMGKEQNLQFVICRFGTICGISPGMRFHTAVNKFCWQSAMNLPVTVWSTAIDQRRPYLTLSDAIKAMQFILSKNMFDREIYNVVTENLTVRDILDSIRNHVEDIKIEYVDSEIMNQLSYTVDGSKVLNKGLELSDSVDAAIESTMNLLRADA